MTKSPSGFFQSEAIFARNLFGATPADAVKLSSERICSRIVRATCVAVDKPVFLRNVEIGFVEGQRFNQVSVAFEDLAHLAGHGPITCEIRLQVDFARSQVFG